MLKLSELLGMCCMERPLQINFMTRQIYTEFLSLQFVGILLGLLLIAGHLVALIKGQQTIDFLKSFPRNKPIGIVLIIINCIWAFWLVNKVDLGEFQKWQGAISLSLIHI